MRDRLIKLLDELGVIVDVPDKVDEDGCGTYTIEGGEYIADYLLANGVIVPPCKVGNTVYRVIRLVNGEAFVKEGIVLEVSSTYENGIGKTRFYFWACGDEWDSRHYSLWCDLTDFGKTVFLTKEEAEAALKGGVQK